MWRLSSYDGLVIRGSIQPVMRGGIKSICSTSSGTRTGAITCGYSSIGGALVSERDKLIT